MKSGWVASIGHAPAFTYAPSTRSTGLTGRLGLSLSDASHGRIRGATQSTPRDDSHKLPLGRRFVRDHAYGRLNGRLLQHKPKPACIFTCHQALSAADSKKKGVLPRSHESHSACEGELTQKAHSTVRDCADLPLDSEHSVSSKKAGPLHLPTTDSDLRSCRHSAPWEGATFVSSILPLSPTL